MFDVECLAEARRLMTVEALRERAREIHYFAEFEGGYDYDSMSVPLAWVLSFADSLRDALRLLTCAIAGHELEDHGFGTPEHGCISICCVRCGFSYPTEWLY